MKAQVTKIFRFEAAHCLPNHDGKCRRPHGHSYKVVITCEGPIKILGGHAKEGMVVDFADIKSFWKSELEPLLDHQDLNETLADKIPVTTAECIASWICGACMDAKLPIREVEVWETETSCARVNTTEVWINGGIKSSDPQFSATHPTREVSNR